MLKKVKVLFVYLFVALIAVSMAGLSSCAKTTSTTAGTTAETAGTTAETSAEEESQATNIVRITGDEKVDVPDGEKFVIGVSVINVDNPYFVTQIDTVKKVSEQYGGSAVEADAQFDPAKQISDIENFIAMNVDGIIIASADSFALVDVVNRATEAGIPVMCMDSGVNTDSVLVTFQSDNFDCGYNNGIYMAEKMNGEGGVVDINYPTVEAGRDREAGFWEALKAYPKISVLDVQKGGTMETGRQLMEAWITAFPDKINAVWAINEQMCIGALNAAEAAGLKDKVFGVATDGMPEGVKAMKSGINLWAISRQFPDKQARLAAESMITVIRGGEVLPEWQGKYCRIKTALITIEDVRTGKYDDYIQGK